MTDRLTDERLKWRKEQAEGLAQKPGRNWIDQDTAKDYANIAKELERARSGTHESGGVSDLTGDV